MEGEGPIEEFSACFADLEDPRDDNARHDLLEILTIAICTMVCGGEDCTDMALFGRAKEPFLRQFLRLRNGIPSHDTFSRLFRLIDPVAFHACFLGFMRRFAETTQGVVAIDGKTLRHSFDRAAGASALHLISAWAADQRLVLGQLAVDSKSNEISALPKLLEMLSLKGAIVTADAMNCQRDIAEQVVAQGGDYVLALKGNQGTLHADVALFLDDPDCVPDTTHCEVDAGHGRIETRASGVSTDIDWLQEHTNGPPSPPSPSLPALARAVPRSRPKPPTISSAQPSAPTASVKWSAATGASKTPCTGCSTSP